MIEVFCIQFFRSFDFCVGFTKFNICGHSQLILKVPFILHRLYSTFSNHLYISVYQSFKEQLSHVFQINANTCKSFVRSDKTTKVNNTRIWRQIFFACLTESWNLPKIGSRQHPCWQHSLSSVHSLSYMHLEPHGSKGGLLGQEPWKCV